VTIVCDKCFFSKIDKPSPCTFIFLPKYNDTSVSKIGDVELSSSTIQKNVLFILDFQFYLIFASKLVKKTPIGSFLILMSISFRSFLTETLMGLDRNHGGLHF